LAIRSLRRRVHTKRGTWHDVPSTSVRGDVEVRVLPAINNEKPSPQGIAPIKGPPSPHTYIASTVVLPQRALISQEGIAKYNNTSGRFSRPFGPISDNLSTSIRPSSSNCPVSVMSQSQRSSYASTIDGNAAVLSAFPPPPVKRFSGLSALSINALASPVPEDQLVHQIFTPILPDELRLTRLGERLAVVRSFDDGWCIVSCPKYRSPCHSNTGSPHSTKSDMNGMKLGVVPFWCFVKPVDGLRSERPIRRSSLGILDNATGFSPRDRKKGGIVNWPAF